MKYPAVVLALSVLGLAACGHDTGKTPAAPTTAPSAGVRVFIDPVTGKARAPTEAERNALPASPTTPLPHNRLRLLPDGSTLLETGPEMMNNIEVQVDSNGKQTTRCANPPKREGDN
jgi:hypothetical protein